MNEANNLSVEAKKQGKKRGQGMTEYIIIVALIAIAAIGIISIFGQQIKTVFGLSANALAGKTSATPVVNTNPGMKKSGMSNFAN